MKDFVIGPSDQTVEQWLQKEALASPFDLKLDWESVPQGFFPVVLVTNQVSPIAFIAVNKDELNAVTSMRDNRKRRIFLVKIDKLLEVAGLDFINYARENGLADGEALKRAELREKEIVEQNKKMLFEGVPQPLGGLTNEVALTRACPDEFRHRNPWTEYAMKLFYCGGNISNWKFKNPDENVQVSQRACFHGFLGTWGVSHEDKEAVAGWMLSEMLSEVPVHIPKPE
ncbi:MAG: hypothetical protein PHC97_01510 [Patescibacteria group bacterium]|nr:hypothetical protein [Patescibacteria group bacterium]